ncbi:hypothetical protein MRX96_037961 [Rhipicephalus microplus]
MYMAVPLNNDAKRQRLAAAYLALREKCVSQRKKLEYEISEEHRRSDDIRQRIQANAFANAEVVAAASMIDRKRWTFQRNERWFADTLPNLGERHFKQAFRV